MSKTSMNMNIRQELIKLLQETATIYQPKLETQLFSKLNDREMRILDWLLIQYQDEEKRRWYDPIHILFSTNFAIDLVEKENLDRLIVTGVILHDIGYFSIDDKTQWSNFESRIIHMQEGSALTARVLYENGYLSSELEKIIGMIAVHDNPYIGIEIKGKDRLGLRDCDRVWVMHMLSYYKDLASQPERLHHPADFLQDRLVQFFGWEQPFGKDWSITLNMVKKNASRIELPTYSLTRTYIKRQLESRIKEQQYINKNGIDNLQKYLVTQIQYE